MDVHRLVAAPTRDVVPPAFDLRSRRLQRQLDDVVERDRLPPQVDPAGGDANHVEQVFQEAHHVLQLACDDILGPA